MHMNRNPGWTNENMLAELNDESLTIENTKPISLFCSIVYGLRTKEEIHKSILQKYNEEQEFLFRNRSLPNVLTEAKRSK